LIFTIFRLTVAGVAIGISPFRIIATLIIRGGRGGGFDAGQVSAI
jgi:hypothetical protein